MKTMLTMATKKLSSPTYLSTFMLGKCGTSLLLGVAQISIRFDFMKNLGFDCRVYFI
jgi:hypothetical protein